MKSLQAFALLALSGTLLLSACKKDDDDEAAPSTPAAAPTPAASTTPNFPGAAGSLWAVKTVTRMTMPFIGTVELDYGTGVAAFWNADNTAFVSAGAITLNGGAMSEMGTHAYTTAAAAPTNPTGTDFSSGVDWTVAGANGIPAFSRSFDASFPFVDTVSSAGTVVRANGYTLTTPAVYGADSVIFTVGGLLRTKAPGTTSCVFTAAELGTLSAGSSIVQVGGYTYTHEVISGKDIYFGKETVQTRSVTIQ